MENNIEAQGSTICQVGLIQIIRPANATAILWIVSVRTWRYADCKLTSEAYTDVSGA